jgi:hypothetical protein
MIVKIYRAKRGKMKRVGGEGERRTNPYKNYTSPPQEFLM